MEEVRHYAKLCVFTKRAELSSVRLEAKSVDYDGEPQFELLTVSADSLEELATAMQVLKIEVTALAASVSGSVWKEPS